MSRSRCHLFAALPLLCSSAGCLLYTDSFNVPPEVELKAPAQMFKGKSGMFTATARDPDERADRLTYDWYSLELQPAQRCPDTAVAGKALARVATRVNPAGRPEIAEITLPKFATYCVWVLVTDDAGAIGFDGESFDVKNQPPSAVLQLVSPRPLRMDGDTAFLPLYSDVRVSAETSDDPEGEPLEFRWKVFGRSGDPISPVVCSGASRREQLCHRLDATGMYRFELETWDGQFASPPATLAVTVMPDVPPCIEQTEPSYQLPRVVLFSTERTNIRVIAVSDDGDAYPAAPGQQPQTQFIWRFGYVGGRLDRLVSTTMPALSFPPESFRPGDEIQVQLDVLDRVLDRDFSACEGQPECQLDAGRDCRQRVSWRVSYL